MKIIGAILILLSSILSSYYYEKGLKNKISKCEEIINFISYIKAQIEYFSYPISVIYKKYDQKTGFIDELVTNQGVKSKTFDEGSDKKLNEFFLSIGKGFKKEQITLCSYQIEHFSAMLAKHKSEYSNKTKVFRAMALFFGICTIILLI